MAWCPSSVVGIVHISQKMLSFSLISQPILMIFGRMIDVPMVHIASTQIFEIFNELLA